MIIVHKGAKPTFRDCYFPHREASLLDALNAVAAGHEPTKETLANAPILTDWMQFADRFYGHYCFSGLVYGHPNSSMPDQPALVHTSAIRAIDLNLHWARTTSRWYRLGRPLCEAKS